MDEYDIIEQTKHRVRCAFPDVMFATPPSEEDGTVYRMAMAWTTPVHAFSTDHGMYTVLDHVDEWADIAHRAFESVKQSPNLILVNANVCRRDDVYEFDLVSWCAKPSQ